MKNKSTKEGTMNKKQIRRYALFLVKKTLGSYHFEENLLDGFFSERQVKKHEKKYIVLKGKIGIILQTKVLNMLLTNMKKQI